MNVLTISKIRDGTVIDHIPAGKALEVLKILGIKSGSRERVSMAMNVESKKMGRKDIVKVEGKFISDEELNRIALIAPKATINIVKDFEISRKFRVSIPQRVEGILRCPNQNCISNDPKEPATSEFRVEELNGDVVAWCVFCGKKVYDVEKYLV
ncbi:aspartate carbamoyltransferase, regulatory subunit [Geoglobus ahangari]|uniref:Aspartate carbamoyltransferase regulatory chain n=1 Tax=Geoglobus ahangari TaxID=113653 RepID=A0A0F7IGP8_9EURY|nr:aspartate carbamoyltransferase regulatory subunit [Geoglobus ahangari]AKG91818.1 aspartate carbamoyltransferase, regulatory subunit [Geoglobus ahangari]